MQKLIKGIIDFRKKSLADYREKFSKLATGQYPDTLFIACCDSRVVPNAFASTDPGDLIVLRNIGNLVPPYQDPKTQKTNFDSSVAATIEFSLDCLNISNIVVCGHSDCAAMRPFVTHAAHTGLDSLNSWLEHAIPSYQAFQQNPYDHLDISPVNRLSRVNVIQQLEHLKTYPLVQHRLESGVLQIHGWWFDLATADIYNYDFEQKNFLVLDEQEAEKILAKL